MSGMEIALPERLLNPTTGEVLPATPENAAALLKALRELKDGPLMEAIRGCEAVLLEESRRLGTKTLRGDGFEAKVTGGPQTIWDVELLRSELERAGCPQERIEALIRQTVEYRVDGSVARQLATNPDYAKAINVARSQVPRPLRVSV